MGEPSRPRDLTRNEALVVKTILGSRSQDSEEDKIHASGLPRTTYQDAKQRLYAWGIVEDRFVPSPQALDLHGVSLLLARPFVDKISTVADSLCALPGTVLVWSGSHAVLALVLHRMGKDVDFSAGIKARIAGSGQVLALLSMEPTEAALPVFFDYEGAWNHFAGTGGSACYPRAFPRSSPHPSLWQPSLRSMSSTISSLLRAPFDGEEESASSHSVSPSTLPRSQRRLLSDGIVEWRPFLSPARIPGLEGGSVGDLILLSGRLLEPEGHRAMLQDLVTRCGVYPFLLASDGAGALMGLLATGSRRSGTVRERSSNSVIGVVSMHLSDIEIAREPFHQVRVLRSHRYDLLLPKDKGGS